MEWKFGWVVVPIAIEIVSRTKVEAGWIHGKNRTECAALHVVRLWLYNLVGNVFQTAECFC